MVRSVSFFSPREKAARHWEAMLATNCEKRRVGPNGTEAGQEPGGGREKTRNQDEGRQRPLEQKIKYGAYHK